MYKNLHYFSCSLYKSAGLVLSGKLSTSTKTLFSSIILPVSSRKMSSIPCKPPNILVYVGENKNELFKNITVNLLSCLHNEKYVVYELKNSQVLQSPWKDCAEVLVVYCEEIEQEITEAFQDYVENGGKILVFCSNFNSKKFGLQCNAAGDEIITVKCNYIKNEVVLYHGKYKYTLEKSDIIASNAKGQAVVMKSMYKAGVVIVSQVNFVLNSQLLPKADDILQPNEDNRLLLLKNVLEKELGCEVYSLNKPVPTFGYIIIDDDAVPSKIKDTKEISLGPFVQDETSAKSNLVVPLLSEAEATKLISFDKVSYFSNLKTKNLGRTVVYFPVVTSTMIPAENLKDHKNFVVVATQQVSGHGRSDNVWISPKGCAMFTLPLNLSLTSRLGQRMSILQHMASLAVVHSIRKHPSYSSLDLRLKWPNDIYFENDKKIGGVLVNTTIQGSAALAFIGIGVNVSNQRPTVCINSAIESHNALTGDTLPLVCTEKVIAGTLSELERLLDDFEKNGSKRFLELYYSYWLHNEQKVLISSLKKEAIIHGLDDYGFLIVQTVDGKRLTLQPDGNRFDMLKNLIIAKE